MDDDDAAVGYCPRCGTPVAGDSGFLQEFWVADESVEYLWCARCRWAGEIKKVTRVFGVEPAQDEVQMEVETLEALLRRS